MRKSLVGFGVVCMLGAPTTHAQNATGASQGSVSDQIFMCQQKVNQLGEQVRPLQTKLASLRAERKGIGASGGEVARFKLANVDQEISQVLKQIEGVNGKIAAEKKHCDELSGKPAPQAAPPAAAAPPSRQKRGRQ